MFLTLLLQAADAGGYTQLLFPIAIGLVVDLTDDTVVVEVDRGTKLRFDRSAIAREVGTKAVAGPADAIAS